MVKELRVSIFANLQAYASKDYSIDEVIRLVKYDTFVKQKTAAYRQMASIISREEANKRVKVERTEAFAVSVLYDGSGKQPENIVRFTGLAMVDLDKIDNGQFFAVQSGRAERTNVDYHADTSKLTQLMQKINSDPHTFICYKTISGDGIRVIYRYQRESIVNGQSSHFGAASAKDACINLAESRQNRTESIINGQSSMVNSQLNGVPWRAAFICGNEYYKQLTGCDYDSACSNYGRLSGLAHDPDVYYNPDAEPFVITDEMIVEANFAEGTQEGRPYKEQTPGSQTTTAKEAWSRVQELLSRRNMVYEPQHRHDYILHACYLFNRFGVPDNELRTWAENQWNDFDARERESLITHCYKKEGEHGTWRLHNNHRKKSHENSMITIAEIRQWLSNHVELAYNVVTDQTMIKTIDDLRLTIDDYHAGPKDEKQNKVSISQWSIVNSQWSIVDDRILATLRSQMAVDTDKRVLKSDVYDVIKSDFAPLVHPVRDYIKELPKWDGTDRISELVSHIHAEALLPGQTQEEAQQDLLWAFHKWMGAMVATWMSDQVANHEIFTIIGRQGIYKTTLFRYLLPTVLRTYFWENAHNTFSTKDDHLALAENCLVDIEEVEASTQHELSELKSLATSDTVKERRPYAKFREPKHRLASLCATGNQQRFLTDETGNRRWLCFKVSSIDDPRTWKLDYRQLYAQIWEELQQGFRYWFDGDDEKRVERINQPFRVESDEEQLIQMRLRPPHEGEPVKLMNAAMVCQLINGGHVGYPLSTRKVSVAMVKLGFEVVHTRRGNMFRVYEIPYDQIQSSLAADAYNASQQAETDPEPELPL